MKKKLMIGLLSSALLVGGATAAFAATNDANLASIKELYQQMFSIQKQIVDKQVEAGAITQDQANIIKEAIDQRAKYNEQAIDNGQAFGPGFGGMGGDHCGGYDYNGGQTGASYSGQGYGMMGAYYNSQY